MIDTKAILRKLDETARAFDFPVLDNIHIALAGARLTAFRDSDQWGIVSEVIGFSEPELEFVDGIYAFGNRLPKCGLQGERIIVSEMHGRPLWNPHTNECIADWRGWSVLVGGVEMSFRPTLEQYAEAGLQIKRPPGPGSITEPEILRFLVHLDGQGLFASDEELFKLVPACRGLQKLIQTTEWQHPDVAAGEKPSQSPAIRSLVESIAAGDRTLFDPGKPNTHWKNWSRT